MKEKKTLTVFTPTYNRAHLLPNLYASLCRQTSKNFVWLIVDDGSVDSTKELVDNWIAEGQIDIDYVFQNNQGMHGAHNTAYKNITTELNTCIDSDDFMPDDAVAIAIDFWKQNGTEKYAGIVGLDVDTQNNIIGTPFTQPTTTVSGFYEQGGSGDKKMVYRTEITNRYPEYPLFEGEKYISLAYKYLLIDQDFELLTINKPLVVVEYQTDGSSMNMFRQYKKNPKGWSFMRKVHMKYRKTEKRKFIECIHYVSTSWMLKNEKFIRESPLKLYTVLAIPFGMLLKLYIDYKTKD